MATKKKKKAPPSTKQAATGSKKVASVAQSETAGSPEQNMLHGVEVLGDVKKGGTVRRPISAQIRLNQIKVIKDFNPRTSIGDIESLSRSIKTDGLLSALVVRPSAKDATFELIAGERRFRALESLEWKEPVPVLIRTDLVGDDDRALAVAVAENSEDGRSNLNVVELGLVCDGFAKKGWAVSRIANECGIHAQKVRRVLEVMSQPKAVRDKLASGVLSLNAGLELAKLDDKTRDDVVKAMEEGGASSAADIKRLRKQVQTEASIEEAATESPKTARGATPKRVATAWRGSREKQAMLQTLSAKLSGLERDEGNADFLEARAMVSVLLWDRGDLQILALPAEDAPDAASKKALKVFWAIVAQEAARASSSDDAEDASDGEEHAETEADESSEKKPKKAKPVKKAKPAKKEAEAKDEDEDVPESDEVDDKDVPEPDSD